jgi:hypothetical protein
MTLQNIVIEVIIIVVLQALGSSFWACIKYHRLRYRLLTTYELLQTTVSKEDRDVLEQESRKIRPTGSSPAEAMNAALAEGGRVQNKRMLLLSIPIAAIIAGSYWLGSTFVSINASVFFILAVFPVTAAVRTTVFADLLKISLILYQWNRENAEACKQFCNEERPVFKNLHKVITEL